MSFMTQLPDLDFDRVFDGLAHQDRRIVLARLVTTDETVPLDELAEHVATNKSLAETDDVTQAVAIRLHHTHLPKLDAMGLVDYDKTGQPTARATTEARRIEQLFTDDVMSS